MTTYATFNVRTSSIHPVPKTDKMENLLSDFLCLSDEEEEKS